VGIEGEGLCWVVDPIDGTLNAMVGAPDFAVSVALVDQQSLQALAAAVYLPRGDVLFDAIRGRGARRDGEPLEELRPSATRIVAFGIPHAMGDVADRMAGALRYLMTTGCVTRQTGAASIDICWVAAGFWRGFFEFRLQWWDFAAAALIAAEAGCVIAATPVSQDCGGTLPLVYDLVVARGEETADLIKQAMTAGDEDGAVTASGVT
jgi:myo-inositol-1(or 4)-monophosphatase